MRTRQQHCILCIAGRIREKGTMQMKTLITGSSTRTIRAQELLGRHGISAQIKRLDSAGDGCVRGLRVEDGQVGRAVGLLSENGIPIRGIAENSR